MAWPAIPPRIVASLAGVALAGVIGSSPLWSASAQNAAAPKQVGPVAVQKALDTGSEWLLRRIEAGTSARHGEPALVAYAAVEGGVDPQHPALLKWADERRQFPATGTYEAACVILALSAIDPARYRAAIEQTAHLLVRWQNKKGDWGYPSGADLSCTQFAALGLWRASQLGYQVPSQTWSRLAARTMDYRDGSVGGFSYSPGGNGSRVSMTLAGLGILALCECELRMDGAWNRGPGGKNDDARQAALRNLEDRFGPTEALMNDWGGYSYYGLERAGAWLGVDQIGVHSWYQRGANLLLSQQSPDGSWRSNAVNTAFSVLFLARATSGTRPRLAFTSGSTHSPQPEIDEDQVCWLKSEGNGPEIEISVDRWQWSAMRDYEFAKERGQGARVSRVELLVDGEVRAVQLLDASRAIGNRRLRFNFVAPSRMGYEVQLAFHVTEPDSKARPKPALRSVLYSAPLSVVALRGLPLMDGTELSIDVLRPRNRLREARATAAVSSRIKSTTGLPKGSHSGASLLDGSNATAWIPRVRDQKQRVTIRIPNGVSANGLSFTPARTAQGGQELAQPRLLEVRINGGDPVPVLMPHDGVTAALKFAEAVELREIELRVRTWSQPEQGKLAPGGIAEVDLLASD